MSKISIRFKIEEKELEDILKNWGKKESSEMLKIKNILSTRLGQVKSNDTPSPLRKKSKEHYKVKGNPIIYRNEKYIIDRYNSITAPKYWEIAEEFRRELKTSKSTESEKKFKAVLKALDVKYEYQHIVFINDKGNFFILDFYLPDYNVGIEIDGGYHFTAKQYVKDSERTKLILRFIKIRSILRFKNKEIDTNQEFLNKVKRILDESGLARVKIQNFTEACLKK